MTSLHLHLCDSDGTNSRLHACDSLLHSFKRLPCSVFPAIQSLTCLVGRTGPVSAMWTVSEQTRCGLQGFLMRPRVLLTSNISFSFSFFHFPEYLRPTIPLLVPFSPVQLKVCVRRAYRWFSQDPLGEMSFSSPVWEGLVWISNIERQPP